MMADVFTDRSGDPHVKPDEASVIPRRSAYGICIACGKILLIKPRWNDSWELPGGGTQEGEEVTQALVREFLEETGYEVKDYLPEPVHIIRQDFYADDLDMYYDSTLHFFRIKSISEHAIGEIDGEEVREVGWIPLPDLKQMRLKPNHEEAVMKCL
ncbi:NUDIX domain-containing protein [Candidatus Altiarchaeota archaeon]